MLEHNNRVINIEDPKSNTKLQVINKEVPLLSMPLFTQVIETFYEKVEEGKETNLEKFKRSILDQTKEYPDPIPVISLMQEGKTIPFLTLKSFSLWQGKQKSKKTTALAIAIASFINGHSNQEGTNLIGAMDGVVLFFDNEQGESYAARTMKLILDIADLETSNKLIYCDLREFSATERMEIMEAGIEGTPSVKIVVVDGVVDLMEDFMDAAEGHTTITSLLKLCSNHDIHIAGVLHQNKNDKNARAHVGSIASQKCEIEITTEVDPKDRAQSIVSCMNSRGMPFEPFAIRWDNGSLPCINQDWIQSEASAKQVNKKYEMAKELVPAIFKPLKSLTFKQVTEEIMLITKQSISTAKRSLADWVSWNLVKKEDKTYRLFAI